MPIGGIAQNWIAESKKSSRKKDPVEEAKRKYKVLPKDLIGVYSDPRSANGRGLEFWNEEDPGSPEYKRPESIPMGKIGVEIFKDISPDDVAGDYVSHYGVKKDPALKELYSRFISSVPQETMQKRYAYHVQNFGEKRDFNSWAEIAGYPELFRGYVFNQFGKDAEKIYTKDQLKILNEVKKYLGNDK